MSKTRITVFLCTGEDCSKAWHHVCDGSPGKWLKRQVEAADFPCKLRIVKTDCMDQCDEAACACCVHNGNAGQVTNIHKSQDGNRLVAAVRNCLERSRS